MSPHFFYREYCNFEELAIQIGMALDVGVSIIVIALGLCGIVLACAKYCNHRAQVREQRRVQEEAHEMRARLQLKGQSRHALVRMGKLWLLRPYIGEIRDIANTYPEYKGIKVRDVVNTYDLMQNAFETEEWRQLCRQYYPGLWPAHSLSDHEMSLVSAMMRASPLQNYMAFMNLFGGYLEVDLCRIRRYYEDRDDFRKGQVRKLIDMKDKIREYGMGDPAVVGTIMQFIGNETQSQFGTKIAPIW